MKNFKKTGYVAMVCLIFLLSACSGDYKEYPVNGGKDTMVTMPCGIGININMTKEIALELINNPNSGIGWCGEDIINISKRDSGR